jgi:glycosyltransferase involved in cell wall biosynthesis
VLPGLARSRGVRLPLFSPCNWGPATLRHQVVVLHDVAPLVVPEYFSAAYGAMARLQIPLLARRVHTVLTVSETSRRDIIHLTGRAEEDVLVVGAGTRVLARPDADLALPKPFFAFVGAHDARKNLEFLLELWPDVFSRTGAHLVVTRRHTAGTTVGSPHLQAPWLTELTDPSDAQLSAVLVDARALLWPSRYEGFGMPLLEAYQFGTGYVATDTGAARELAVAGDAVLPLDREAWIEAIKLRVHHDPGNASARRAVAASHNWDDVAERVLTALCAAER